MTDSNDIPEYGTPGAEGAPDPAGRPDAKQAWSDAGERLGGLGAKLKSHYENQATEGTAGSTELKEAAKKLGEAVEAAFHTIGVAAKDKSVQDDVKQVGRSVADALAGTFAGLSGEMKKTFGKQQQGADAETPPPPVPSPPPAAPSDPPTSTSTPPAAPSDPPAGTSNPPAEPGFPPPGSVS